MLNAARALFFMAVCAVACTGSRGDVLVSKHGDATAGNAGTGSDACAGALFCSSLESPPETLEVTGTGSAQIVDAPSHSRGGALRVSVAGANDLARFRVPLPGLRRVGVRAWVQLDAAATDFGDAEVHVLIAIHPAPELGVGGTNKVSADLEQGFELVLVETLVPTKTSSNASLVPGTWHCLQLEIGGQTELEQATLSLDGSPRATTAVEPNVVSPGGFQMAYLGIEYSTGDTPLTLYFDDIVVAENAVGCD